MIETRENHAIGGAYLTIDQVIDLLVRYKRELEGLTPGGSEFVNEPERCSEFVREKQLTLMRLWLKAKRMA